MVIAGVGDRVTLEVLEGERPVLDAPVTGIVNEAMGWPAFMDVDALGVLLGESDVVSGVYAMIDPDREAAFSEAVLARPSIASVALQRASIESFNETMEENINIMMTIYALIGGAIAAAVVYNAARISLTERGRELASLRVLGFTEGEVSYILIGELGLLVFLALPLGGLLGMGLAYLVASSMATELFRIPVTIDPSTHGMAATIVVVSSIAAALFVRQRVKTLDLIAVLKTRE
jgi:putative ABC transport system permease protein